MKQTVVVSTFLFSVFKLNIYIYIYCPLYIYTKFIQSLFKNHNNNSNRISNHLTILRMKQTDEADDSKDEAAFRSSNRKYC